MKMLCFFVVSAGILSLAMVGCERHEFSETKGLHQEHGKHHAEHHEEGHDAHAKDGHAKDEVHAKEAHSAAEEKKEAAPAPEKKTEAPRATGI